MTNQALLFYFAFFMFIVIAPKIFRPSAAFSPAWWAISFPMAALTNVALKYAEFRASMPRWNLAVVLLVLSIAVNGKLFR